MIRAAVAGEQPLVRAVSETTSLPTVQGRGYGPVLDHRPRASAPSSRGWSSAASCAHMPWKVGAATTAAFFGYKVYDLDYQTGAGDSEVEVDVQMRDGARNDLCVLRSPFSAFSASPWQPARLPYAQCVSIARSRTGISRGASSPPANPAGRLPRRASRAGSLRNVRREPGPCDRRSPSDDGRCRWRPGPAFRADRALVPARPAREEILAPDGSDGLRLRVPLSGRRRVPSRAVRPTHPRRRGPLQLGSDGGLQLEGWLRSRAAWRLVSSAVRIDRGGVRSRHAANRKPRAPSLYARRRARGRGSGHALPLARHRCAARSRPQPGRPRTRHPAATWWRRDCRFR